MEANGADGGRRARRVTPLPVHPATDRRGATPRPAPTATAPPTTSAALPRREELARSLQAVPGVAAAAVVPGPSGRDRLRLQVHPGEDLDRVRAAVAATLQERFGIAVEPASIRLAPTVGLVPGEVLAVPAVPGVPVGAPAPLGDALTADRAVEVGGSVAPEVSIPRSARRGRAAIRAVEVHRDADEVRIEVTLAHADRQTRVVRTVIPTRRAVWRGLAESAATALRDLAGSELLAAIDEVRVDAEAAPAAVVVLVTVVSADGEHRGIGSAGIDGDEDLAIVRATLDALNRHIQGRLAPRSGDRERAAERIG